MKFDTCQKFTVKWVLPAGAGLFSFFVIGKFYTTSLKENELVRVSGRVTNIIQDEYKHYKYTDDRIRIWLNNQPHTFYFWDKHGDNFRQLMTEIKPLDTVTLYHRTSFQTLIGRGSEYNIMKIEKNNTVLYSLDQAVEDYRRTGKGLMWITLLMWALNLFLIKKLQQSRRST